MNIFIDTKSKSAKYQMIRFLGEGQFANVYLAKDSRCKNKYVAIKKIKGGTKEDIQDGINRSALREIKMLKELDHPNIVKLCDIYGEDKSISLVFEFMATDLENVIKKVTVLEFGHIKNISIQLLQGLEYLHYNYILHRDLKPNNLFLSTTGEVKIGDFGLARHLTDDPDRPMTTQVVTRWYRCPELLLSVNLYCFGVDLWAVGCIIAEMFLRVPLFAGDSDIDQLNKIFQVTGVPTEERWTNYKSIRTHLVFKECPMTPYREIFTAVSDEGIDLLSGLLSLDPVRRGTCSEALQHPYFVSEPYPCHNSQLPLPPKDSESPTTKRRKVDSRMDVSMARMDLSNF